ncbi:MAG: PilZ domain-containing protein [Burkholderiales bacterium]
MQNDARRFSRFSARADAVLVCLPRIYEGTLIDISEQGALLRLDGKVEIQLGDQTRLRVLTAKGNQAFEVRARLAYRSGQNIGLQIDIVDQYAKGSLYRLIGMRPDAADLAARSLPDLIDAGFRADPMPSAGGANMQVLRRSIRTQPADPITAV